MFFTKKVSFICHALAATLMLIGGLVYFMREAYLPYHADATNHAWGSLEPGIQILFQAMLNGAGGLMIAIALTLIILLSIPFRRGEKWSYWVIPFIGICAMLTTLRSTLLVEMSTAAHPPWIILLVVTALFLVGLIFSLVSLKQETK